MRGRKPNSPKVVDLKTGRATGQTPPPAPPRRIEPPDWVAAAGPRAVDCWEQTLPDLQGRRQYLRLFEAELGRYCIFFADFCKADQKVRELGELIKSPKGYPMHSPYLSIRNRAHEAMLRLAADLGLNPVAQVRMAGLQLDLFETAGGTAPPPPDGAPPDPDDFAQFRAR